MTVGELVEFLNKLPSDTPVKVAIVEDEEDSVRDVDLVYVYNDELYL